MLARVSRVLGLMVTLLLMGLLLPSVAARVVVEAPRHIILVPPYRYTCVNITFYNNDNTSHVVNLAPVISSSTLPYVLGSRFSATIFTLPPLSKRIIEICFKPIYVAPRVISNYTIRVFLDGQLFKLITLRLWYNYFYNFTSTVIVLPPRAFLDRVSVLVELYNSGTLPDNYTIAFYVNGRMVEIRRASMLPGEIRFFHYTYRSNSPEVKIVRFRVEIKSEDSICRKSYEFKLIHLLNPLEALVKLMKIV